MTSVIETRDGRAAVREAVTQCHTQTIFREISSNFYEDTVDRISSTEVGLRVVEAEPDTIGMVIQSPAIGPAHDQLQVPPGSEICSREGSENANSIVLGSEGPGGENPDVHVELEATVEKEGASPQ